MTDNGTNIFDAGTGNDTVFFQSAGADTISGSTVKGGAAMTPSCSRTCLLACCSLVLLLVVLVTTPSQSPMMELLVPRYCRIYCQGWCWCRLSCHERNRWCLEHSPVLIPSASSTVDPRFMDTLTFNTAAVSADAAGFTYASARIHIFAGMGINTGVSSAGAVGRVSASGGFVV